MKPRQEGRHWWRYGLGLGVLLLALPQSHPLFAALFPELPRPLYEGDPFWKLTLDHLALVSVSSLMGGLGAVAAGVCVTRPGGAEYRGVVQTLSTMGQTIPPVAVLALAVPLMGFGAWPAVLALTLYGLLPVVENTITGLSQVPASVREAAFGSGMTASQVLWQVDLPLAAPIILAGLRTSVTINVGTAAIAATVGAKCLGLPIIIGLNAANLAYVLQGAVLVGLLALFLDQTLARLAAWTAAEHVIVPLKEVRGP